MQAGAHLLAQILFITYGFFWGGGRRNLTDNRLASPVVDATVSRTLDPPLFLPPRKRSLRRLCFHRCLSVHRGVSVQGDICSGGVSV